MSRWNNQNANNIKKYKHRILDVILFLMNFISACLCLVWGLRSAIPSTSLSTKNSTSTIQDESVSGLAAPATQQPFFFVSIFYGIFLICNGIWILGKSYLLIISYSFRWTLIIDTLIFITIVLTSFIFLHFLNHLSLNYGKTIKISAESIIAISLMIYVLTLFQMAYYLVILNDWKNSKVLNKSLSRNIETEDQQFPIPRPPSHGPNSLHVPEIVVAKENEGGGYVNKSYQSTPGGSRFGLITQEDLETAKKNLRKPSVDSLDSVFTGFEMPQLMPIIIEQTDISTSVLEKSDVPEVIVSNISNEEREDTNSPIVAMTHKSGNTSRSTSFRSELSIKIQQEELNEIYDDEVVNELIETEQLRITPKLERISYSSSSNEDYRNDELNTGEPFIQNSIISMTLNQSEKNLVLENSTSYQSENANESANKLTINDNQSIKTNDSEQQEKIINQTLDT